MADLFYLVVLPPGVDITSSSFSVQSDAETAAQTLLNTLTPGAQVIVAQMVSVVQPQAPVYSVTTAAVAIAALPAQSAPLIP